MLKVGRQKTRLFAKNRGDEILHNYLGIDEIDLKNKQLNGIPSLANQYFMEGNLKVFLAPQKGQTGSDGDVC